MVLTGIIVSLIYMLNILELPGKEIAADMIAVCVISYAGSMFCGDGVKRDV
jgi:hypothetical protein